MKSAWCPEWIAEAQRLWDEGLPCAEILERLGDRFAGFDKSEGSFCTVRNRRREAFPLRGEALRRKHIGEGMRSRIRR